MSSISGLSLQHRLHARARTKQAALLGLHHASVLHYTQSSARWQGIRSHLVAKDGHYPNWADCSAFATWCLWNGLHVTYGVRDVVNGANWNYGYTGTQVRHGKQVRSFVNVRPGDLAHYGNPYGPTGHVAVCVGSGLVVSFGSEAGPFLLPIRYRRDFRQIRRYI
jgi:hypothetical protein